MRPLLILDCLAIDIQRIVGEAGEQLSTRLPSTANVSGLSDIVEFWTTRGRVDGSLKLGELMDWVQAARLSGIARRGLFRVATAQFGPKFIEWYNLELPWPKGWPLSDDSEQGEGSNPVPAPQTSASSSSLKRKAVEDFVDEEAEEMAVDHESSGEDDEAMEDTTAP